MQHTRKFTVSKSLSRSLFALSALGCAHTASAFDWMDNSVGYRYGTRFAEPFNTQDISKNIVNFTHSDGYKYGTNFLNVDVLKSDNKDDSATEVYVTLPQHTGYRQSVRQESGHSVRCAASA